ncbi:MAG: ComEC/Rec2 family competence protein [Oligosphaeraceae bacterium]
MSPSLRQLRVTAPAFWAFGGLSWGALCAARGGGWLWCAGWAAGWLGVTWLSGARGWRWLAWGLLPLAGWGWFLLREAWGEDALAAVFPRERTSGSFSLVVAETPLTGGLLAPWDGGGGRVVGELRRVATRATGGTPTPVRHRVWLQGGDAREQSLLRELPEGTLLEGRAVFLPLAPDDSLRARGVRREARLTEWRVAGRERRESPLRKMRERLGLSLVEGLSSPLEGQMALALGLGASEALPRAWRRRQAWAGTIHAFAISGMHVGMVAWMAGLALRWAGMSLAWRRAALGALLTGYVLMTGASASGLRALGMVLAVIYARMRWRAPVWANAQGLSGLAALAFQPLCVLNVGFLYSHTVVAMLLFAAPLFRELGELLEERQRWLPREMRRHRRILLAKWVAGTLGAGILAWCAALWLSLETNGRLGLLAPLVNLPLGALVTLILAFLPLRLLLGLLLPRGTPLWAGILGTLLRLAGRLSTLGSQGGSCVAVAAPPLWTRLLFLLSLWAALCRLRDQSYARRYSAGSRESKR